MSPAISVLGRSNAPRRSRPIPIAIVTSARVAAPNGWLTGSWTSCAPIPPHTPERYRAAPRTTTSAAAISSGRRVVVGFMVVTLIVSFLSSLALHRSSVDAMTLVDRRSKHTHRNVQQGVYFFISAGKRGVERRESGAPVAVHRRGAKPGILPGLAPLPLCL